MLIRVQRGQVHSPPPLLLFVFWVNGQYGEMALVLNELANWCIFFLLIGLQFKLLPPFLREAVFGQRANS